MAFKASFEPFQTMHKGYDTNAVPQRLPPHPNGYLSFPGKGKCWLWVSELRANFSISGQRAQSRRTRSFFPHNFVQPSFAITCQCATQAIYAYTAEYIRATQTSMNSQVHLWVVNTAHYRSHRNIRGRHRSNVAEGYIKSVKREHGRFIYAPELTFEFVVEKHLQPSGWRDDDSVSQKVRKTWKEIIEDGTTAYAKDPDPDLGWTWDEHPSTPLAPGPDGSPRPG